MGQSSYIYVLYRGMGTSNTTEPGNQFVSSLIGRLKNTIEGFIPFFHKPNEFKKDNVNDLNKSGALIVFFENGLFFEQDWVDVWNYFLNQQKQTPRRIIFPVQLEPLDFKGVPDKYLNIIEKVKMLGMYNYFSSDESSFILLRDAIIAFLNERKKSVENNVYIIDSEIEKKIGSSISVTDENMKSIITKVTSHRQNQIDKERKGTRNYVPEDKIHLPVCAIYTGGTVGQIRENLADPTSTLIKATLSQLKSNMPRLNDLGCLIHLYSYSYDALLDSSNIGSAEWKTLSLIVHRLYNYYQGFVIIHGSNTMAYTASALSFMLKNLEKPVVLTGSELPLSALNSDAEQNVLRAISIASPKTNNNEIVKEVSILFGRALLRGNRTTKQIALDTSEGFYSPNYNQLASITHETVIPNHSILLQPKNNYDIELFMSSEFEDSILLWNIYPDMDMKLFRTICEYRPSAMILRTYGTGGVPDQNPEFMRCLDILKIENVVVVNITQCPIGGVELRLFETNSELFGKGVVNCGDMLTEAAYCKLKYLFALYKSNPDWSTNKKIYIDCIRQDMTVSLRGELSLSTYFAYSAKKSYSIDNVEWAYIEHMDFSNSNRQHETRQGMFNNYFIHSVVVHFDEFAFVSLDDKQSLSINVYFITGSQEYDMGNCLLSISEKGAYAYMDITSSFKEYHQSGKTFSLKLKSSSSRLSFASVSVVVTVKEQL